MDKHYCKKHCSTYGFINEEGIWICWQCYKEDKYVNPDGPIADKYENSIYSVEARKLLIGSHEVRIEVWLLKDKRKVLKFQQDYRWMSRANRDWDPLIERIDAGEAI